MAEPEEPQPPTSKEEVDAAAEAGRLAGQAVNALGMRLLRLRSVRRAIRRGVAEAASHPPGPGSVPPSGCAWPGPLFLGLLPPARRPSTNASRFRLSMP